jgi:hypothetical protein
MRTVIEAQSVSTKIYTEVSTYPRLEEAFDALKWWLAHNPDSGELIDDYHWLYKQRGNRELKIPALVAIYTFTEDEVEILSILVRLPTL